jgi:hypothetical protein
MKGELSRVSGGRSPAKSGHSGRFGNTIVSGRFAVDTCRKLTCLDTANFPE